MKNEFFTVRMSLKVKLLNRNGTMSLNLNDQALFEPEIGPGHFAYDKAHEMKWHCIFNIQHISLMILLKNLSDSTVQGHDLGLNYKILNDCGF